MKRLLAAVFLCTLGCTSLYQSQSEYQALEKANVCCATYRDITYAQLQRGTEQRAMLGPGSPIFQFEYQRSYFAAFELLQGASQKLVVKTFPTGSRLQRSEHVLIPTVEFLDANFKSIGVLRPTYQARAGLLGAWGEASIVIPSDAKFVLLYEALRMPGLAWRDSDQPSGTWSLPAGATGEVSVTVSNV